MSASRSAQSRSTECVPGRVFAGWDLEGVQFKIADKYKVSKLRIDIQSMVRQSDWNPDKYVYSYKLEERVLRTIDMNSLMESDT